MNKYTVEIFPARDVPEEAIVIEGVTSITYVDNESHGEGPVGRLPVAGERRLIISSPNTMCTAIYLAENE